MKRIVLLMLCLMLLAACAVTPEAAEPTPPPTPEPTPTPIHQVEFTTDALYAVAYVGYQEDADPRPYYDAWLFGREAPTHFLSDGDCYLIIPRYEGMHLTLLQGDLETYPADPVPVYETFHAEPFLLRCNVSDIFPDATIRLTYEGETVEFSPYLSLKDGAVEIGDRGELLKLEQEDLP